MSTDGFELPVNGARSSAEIEYYFFLDIYEAYNQGHDEFHQQEDNLKWDLMEAKGVDQDAIDDLKKKLQMVAQENKNLKEDTGDVEALDQESVKVLSDIQGM